MNDWTTSTLEEGLDRLIDYRGKSPPKSVTGIPVISAKVVKTSGLLKPIEQKISPSYYSTWMKRGLPQIGDVILTTEGPLGEVIQLDSESVTYALGQRVVCLRGKPGVLDNTFLRYLLTSPAQQEVLASYATGTTVAGISQKSLRSIPISYPSFEEQRRLGEVLCALDDKIDLNRRMNETLEAMAQAIFRDWFVDFGPVRRKMAGATGPVAIMGGLTSDPTRAAELAALFPDALGDDDLPVGWRLTKLGDAFDVKIGRTPPRKESEHFAPKGGGEHWMSIRDMGACGAFITSTAEDLTKIAVERFRVPPIPDKTVVVSFKLTVGRVAITTGTMFSNEAIAQLRAKKGSPSAWFTYCWMKIFDYSQLGSTSSIATAVNSDSIKGIDFPVVVEAVLEAFDRIAEPIFERIRTSTLESDTLAITRDYLLPRLMSGEVRVGDAALEIAA